MVDIVRIFEKFATDKSYEFDYGTKASLNLLGGTNPIEDISKIYLLLERRKGTSKQGSIGSLEGVNYTGYFFLCKHSDLDLDNFNSDNTNSKYKDNIEPLLNAYKSLFNYFGCTEIEINSFEFQDVTDILDQNMDGLLINYNIFVPINYEL